MCPVAPHENLPTHAVTNQPDARLSRDLWHEDQPLREQIAQHGGDGDVLSGAGQAFGSAQALLAAQDARRDKPRLIPFDRAGRRIDEVAFNSGYHQIMDLGATHGYASVAWRSGANGQATGKAGGHVTHAALVYQMSQVEPGVCCPLTMTYAAVPALRREPSLARIWEPKLTAPAYDPRVLPVEQKQAATLGMAMTEKQGGSDVRANTTQATRDGDEYRLVGHKWFCSAPMSDGFLTLAQAPGGLTCFLVPRWLPDGTRNRIYLQRLKDKLGNVANASSEIEYDNALAHRVGDEGAGVKTIVEMVHHTRLDTALAPAGLMRAALSEAHWWVSHRSAFQKRLIDQPLMRRVLADLALDHEAALALGLGVARAFDRTTQADRAFARIGVALAKFLSNKVCPNVIYESMEMLGGMGYVEETPMPMLYREAPLNSIWEGSGNVICLDILRSLQKIPMAGEQLSIELGKAVGSHADYDAAIKTHMARFPGLPDEADARWYVESLATLLSASFLIRTAPAAVSDGYVISRLSPERGRISGALRGLDETAILARLGAY